MVLKLQTANLEDGMPTVPQAQARLTAELRAARARSTKVLKIIHGYGSTGVGGDLRIAIQATLRQLVESGEIRACIFGENWRRGDEESWDLVKRFPALKDDHDFGRGNKGITLVVL
jgi:hypothetical protein